MATAKIGIDRVRGILHGFVVAQYGVFADGRGRFEEEDLQTIIRLASAAPGGLRSNFDHSGGLLGTFLGRATGFFLSTAKSFTGAVVPAVRANLRFDESAKLPPPMGGVTPLADYVLTLCASDVNAISASLVLVPDKIESANSSVPRWRPRILRSIDVVSEGAAVGSLLSPLPSPSEGLDYRRRRAESRGIRARIAELDAEIHEHYRTEFDEGNAKAELELRKRRNRANSRAVVLV